MRPEPPDWSRQERNRLPAGKSVRQMGFLLGHYAEGGPRAGTGPLHNSSRSAEAADIAEPRNQFAALTAGPTFYLRLKDWISWISSRHFAVTSCILPTALEARGGARSAHRTN